MRISSKVFAGVAATAAVAGMSLVPAMASAATPATNVAITGGNHTVYYGIEANHLTWKATGGSGSYTWTVAQTSGTSSPCPAAITNNICVPNGVWATQAGTGNTSLEAGGTWEPLVGGIPTTGANYKYTVTVTDGTTSAHVTVTVDGDVPDNSSVGVGSNTTQNVVNQFSNTYNAQTGANKPANDLFSYDATDPVTNVQGGNIEPKAGCTAIARPNGSGAGILALTTENGTDTAGGPCLDYARSSRTRGTSDSTDVSFLAFAGDGITYSAVSGSYAPANLTATDLENIYQCVWTNWNQVPGDTHNQPITPIIPQSGSGTRSTWLAAVGVTTPGTCIVNGVDPSGTATPGAPIEENEGINAIFSDTGTFGVNNPNPKTEIYPFSIGAWTTQKHRDPACVATATCDPGTGISTNLETTYNDATCYPTASSQNQYGCDENGVLQLKEINSTAPTTAGDTGDYTNPAFPAQFDRTLYNVAYDTAEGTQPSGTEAPLEAVFGPAGWACTNATATSEIKAYGWLSLGAGCGAAS